MLFWTGNLSFSRVEQLRRNAGVANKPVRVDDPYGLYRRRPAHGHVQDIPQAGVGSQGRAVALTGLAIYEIEDESLRCEQPARLLTESSRDALLIGLGRCYDLRARCKADPHPDRNRNERRGRDGHPQPVSGPWIFPEPEDLVASL